MILHAKNLMDDTKEEEKADVKPAKISKKVSQIYFPEFFNK